ncbi:hypothetical protein HD554DRAFT_820680 [Boletus coccyginus]|nr:hypothetical protein HD554DRAFT_820680 [Boletus coccyginus]
MSLAPLMIQNNIPTQRMVHKSPSIGELSIIQRGSTAVDVCGHDTTFPSFLGTSEFFYDPRAGAYENPLITATSRALISDISPCSFKGSPTK